MGTLNMKVLIVLVSVVACAVAQNVVCGKGTTNKEVTVEDKKTYTFKTQKGKKYLANTKCTVNYKMGDSCKKMSFACTKIGLKGDKKCKRGDKLTVTANGKSKSYCKPKPKPKVSSTGDLSVVFTSDKKQSAAGAVCKVRCIEASSVSTGCSGCTACTTGCESCCITGSNCACVSELSDTTPQLPFPAPSPLQTRGCSAGQCACPDTCPSPPPLPRTDS